jgi:hypothetical protein
MDKIGVEVWVPKQIFGCATALVDGVILSNRKIGCVLWLLPRSNTEGVYAFPGHFEDTLWTSPPVKCAVQNVFSWQPPRCQEGEGEWHSSQPSFHMSHLFRRWWGLWGAKHIPEASQGKAVHPLRSMGRCQWPKAQITHLTVGEADWPWRQNKPLF